MNEAADIMPVDRWVALEDCEIAICEAGEGPTVVLAHGYPQHRAMWRDVFKALSADFHVVAFDWPSWGASRSHEGATARYEVEVARMIALSDALGIKQAHWVLHDYGGYIGLGMVQRASERVSSLTILNSRAHRTFPGMVGMATRVILGLLRVPFMGWLFAACLPIGWLHRLGLCFFRSDGPGRSYTQCMNTVSGRLSWRRDMSCYHLPARPELLDGVARLTTPSLFLYGDDDPFCPFFVAEELHAASQHGTLIRLEGGGHFVVEERSDEVIQYLVAFLTQQA